MKRLRLIFILIFIPCFVQILTAEDIIRIMFTSSLNGNLDGCNCHDSPKAGLVKRAVFLRNTDLKDVILIDAGDIFSTSSDELLHKMIIDSYIELGYDLVCVGDQDFAEGYSFLQKYGKKLFASNNMLLDGKLFSNSPYTRKISGTKVRIFTITDEEVFQFYPAKTKKDISFLDYKKLLLKNIDEEYLDIVMFHGRAGGAEKLAKDIDGIDIIIFGHEQMLLGPQKINNCYIISPGEQGNRIGILILTVKDGQIKRIENEYRYFDYKSDPDDSVIRSYIDKYYEALSPKIKK